MPKIVLTPANIRFIVKNRLVMSGADMARKIGVSKAVVQRYMRTHKLCPPKRIQKKFRIEGIRKVQLGKTSSTPEMDKIIKANYLTVPSKTLAKQLGKSDTFLRGRLRQLGLVIPKSIIEERKKSSRYVKGHVPFNKGKKMSPEVYEKAKRTMFKKGNIPPNTKERDGVITIRHEHPDRNNSKMYKYIRISLGKWQLYHQYRWEKFRGKVPPGHCLWFKDGDSMNCSLKNLECITRAENARRNRARYAHYPQELKEVIRLKNKLNKKIHEKFNR